MISPEDIHSRITEALPGATVDVQDMTGGGDHYEISIVAEQFAGKTLIARHRMVHAPLKDVLGGALHAIKLDTRTPDEAAPAS